MEGEKLQELVKKQTKIIKRQEARIAGLEAQIVELRATIARLQKDSRNSSKPPSSDIVKPKPEAHKNNRGKPLKIGGQKGHKKHERTPFPPDQV
jgi:transposase